MRSMCDLTPRVGSGDSALDKRLSDELDRYNAAATPGVAPAEELTVRIEDVGELGQPMSVQATFGPCR
jgi:hypothetical protein